MEKNVQTISGRQLIEMAINRLLDIPVPARYKEMIADPIGAVAHDLGIFVQIIDKAQANADAKKAVEESEMEFVNNETDAPDNTLDVEEMTVE